ncbi:hypothetical protein NC653_032011 [Populus alba x Populus x berolinensis]|uniref:Uncharacterized protein n=1 Tax=Populus alba x Populus x berolinensis TaxID=444605 RepID=A0AAD6Q288_9ROSI|nr:hypothetical protein NC653_032011 [Populus alba x Populus x berolinensis]
MERLWRFDVDYEAQEDYMRPRREWWRSMVMRLCKSRKNGAEDDIKEYIKASSYLGSSPTASNHESRLSNERDTMQHSLYTGHIKVKCDPNICIKNTSPKSKSCFARESADGDVWLLYPICCIKRGEQECGRFADEAFSLELAIVNYTQGDLSIQDYYSGFLTLWNDYSDLGTAKISAEGVSDRWIALKLFSRVSGGCFTWSSVESVLHDDDVRSGLTTDPMRVPDQNVHNYRSDRWIALKLFSRVSGGCFTWSSVESVLHDDDVRSDRWIALKLFSRVSGGCFTWSSVESVLHDDDVRSGLTTDPMRVPDQNVHNYRSDRWIALKLFSRVSGGCFTWSSVESVHNYRSDRWIALKFFHEFPEAVLHGVALNRFATTTMRSGGLTTDPMRVPDQKVHNYRSDRWIALKLFSRVSGGCFTWSSVESVCHSDDARESVLHDDDVRSGLTTDPMRVPDQKVHNYRSDRWIALKLFSRVSGGYRSDRWIALKLFSRVSGGCFTWSSVESVLHDDDVRSGLTTDPMRVPDQNVHNYRSDRWIALKLFSRVSGGCFTWSSVESVLHDDDVRSGLTTDPMRVPDQKVHNYRSDRWIALKLFSRVSGGCFTWSSVESVHNYRSDRWIALKLFSRVSGGCFTWSSVESVLHDDDVRSGLTTDPMRVPDQNVHNYRSDRWIALKLFSRVSGGCFTWSSVESVLHDDDVRSGLTTDPMRVPDQNVHNYRSDRWIALKLFSRVFGGCFTWSSVESVCHDDDAVQRAIRPTHEVPVQKVHNYRSDRWIALKLFSRVSGGCFTWSSVESVLHDDDVSRGIGAARRRCRSGLTTDPMRVPDQNVHNYRSDRWIALKLFSRVSGGCFTWSSVESVCTPTMPVGPYHRPDESDRWIALKLFSRVSGGCFTWSSVESVCTTTMRSGGLTTDPMRVPVQKVHNYRSDRWIALKLFSRRESVCTTTMRSAAIRPTHEVPDQKVHNYRSDRWIALKLFSRVSGGCFTWSSVESVLHDDDVRSGLTTDPMRVPDQNVHNYRSDRWIALKLFSRRESVLHDDDVRSGLTTDPMRVPDQNVHNYRSDRWIALKLFSRVSGGCFTWSSVESVLHDDDVRSGLTPTR